MSEPVKIPLTDEMRKRQGALTFKGSRHRAGPDLTCTWPKDAGKWRCRARVRGHMEPVQCGKVGKVQDEDGLWWCGVHSPVAVERRHVAHTAKVQGWENKWAADRAVLAANRAARERHAAELVVFRGTLRQIAEGHNDPRTLAMEILALWPEIES